MCKKNCTVVMQLFQWNEMVGECLHSLAKQTRPPVEIIMLHRCDGEALTVLKDKTSSYANIRLVRERGISLADALNQGIEMAKTDFIARMDVDDVAMSDRLALQVRFMEEHPNIAVCGSAFHVYETNESIRPPQKNDAIRARMLFASPFCHPSVVLRKEAVLNVGGYDVTCTQVEDYDLWLRMAAAGLRLANLPQHLVRYRVHPDKDRSAVFRARREAANTLRENFYMQYWGRRLSLPCFLADPTKMRLRDILLGWKWLWAFRRANAAKPFVPPKVLDRELAVQAVQCIKEYIKSRKELSSFCQLYRTVRNHLQRFR